ncbi:hypothetical protein [Dactylosporangium sp. CA-092794]|uniref:hypothetical protein n=1 Tax=Dactylosporangium sp. CA-092794 TaxID=3239929 RepID=UPI003D945BF0
MPRRSLPAAGLQGDFLIYSEELTEVLSINGLEGVDRLTDVDPQQAGGASCTQWRTGGV